VRLLFSFFVIIATTTICAAQCLNHTDAGQHIGEVRCVSGKIYHINQLEHGVTVLSFCADSPVCPFSAVVFARNLKNVGDVRQLQGRAIEVHGKVTEYQGRAEIIIDHARQLGGDGARLPPLPKEYDVEKKGHYSAGTFSLPHATHPATTKKQAPTYPVEIPDDPE
jgi:exonuclease VII large subunit